MPTITQMGTGGALSSLQMFQSPGDRIGAGLFKVVFDSAYPTNGELVDLSKYFLELFDVFVSANGTYMFKYTLADKKLVVYDAIGSEVGNGTDLSALTVYLFAFGRK